MDERRQAKDAAKQVNTAGEAQRPPRRMNSPVTQNPNPLKRVLRALASLSAAMELFVQRMDRPGMNARADGQRRMNPAFRMVRYQVLAATALAMILLALARMSAYAQSGEDGKLERGAQLFAENCAVCHGPNGEGRIGATLAKDWPAIRPDLTVRTIIENGVAGSPMPAWSQANGGPLNAEDIDALVYFILSWQTGGFPQFTPRPTATAHPPITPIPQVAGDPNQGAVLYAENCMMCHGPNGEGRIGATLAKVWSGIRPDLEIKATIQNGISGSPMPAWGQSNGGPLSDGEIDNLVAYILTWENSPVAQPQPAATPEAALSPFFSGWGGVLVTIVLLAAVIGMAALLQRRETNHE